MFDQAISNTRETISICDEGLALDKDRTYYEPDKRALVQEVRRDAVQRLANLIAMREAERG